MSQRTFNTQELGETLTSDTDVCRYLQSELIAAPTCDDGPVLTYFSERDFDVEPLETDTTAYLINLFADRSSAEPVSEYRLTCWTPLSNETLRIIKNRLSQWGYEIITVKRVNRTDRLDPVVEIVAERTPSPDAQFKALGIVDPDAKELLDAWALIAYNRHQHTDDEITPQEWASIRGVPVEEIESNIEVIGEQIREAGGLPGTQWAIREDGGIEY